jgi:hypothetical protein
VRSLPGLLNDTVWFKIKKENVAVKMVEVVKQWLRVDAWRWMALSDYSICVL